MNDSRPGIDPTAPLQFVINAAAGSNAADAKREVIEAALDAAGRQGNLLFSDPANLARVANQAAARALATRTTACFWSTPAWGSTPTCWKTARPHSSAGLRRAQILCWVNTFTYPT